MIKVLGTHLHEDLSEAIIVRGARAGGFEQSVKKIGAKVTVSYHLEFYKQAQVPMPKRKVFALKD